MRTQANKGKKIPSVVTYLRSSGAVSFLLAVAALMQLPMYFNWFVTFVYLTILLLAVDLYYEFRHSKLVSKIVASVILLLLVSLFTFGFVVVKGPLSVSAVNFNAAYPPDTKIGGIEWSKKFNELRIRINNPTNYDYYDIDVVIKPNEPVAAIAQMTNIPAVTFTDPLGVTVHTEMLVAAERVGKPVVLLATNGGHRLQCDKLPKKSVIEIIIAIASPNDERKGGFDLPDSLAILKINFSNGEARWFAFPGWIEEIYGTRPQPRSVQVTGEYTVFQRRRGISEKIRVTDFIHDHIMTQY